jgi:hypothetical protein
MEATYGAGTGWVRLQHSEWPGHLFLRLEPDERGRWRTKDLILRGEWRSLVPADLRELNLAAIEEWLQADVDLMEHMAGGQPGPDLDAFIEGFGPESKPVKRPEVERLRRPERGLTDDFLRHVAAAYRQAVVAGQAPAPELARQVGDGATPRTIHKWVAVARQRSLMAPAARKKS